MFGIFSFLVQSCVWGRKNVKQYKEPGWTVLVALKQDFVHVTTWIAWIFKNCVTIAKSWCKNFMETVTWLLKSFCNTVLNIQSWFIHICPTPLSSPQHTLGLYGDEAVSVSVRFFTARTLMWVFFLNFFLKKKNFFKKKKNQRTITCSNTAVFPMVAK